MARKLAQAPTSEAGPLIFLEEGRELTRSGFGALLSHGQASGWRVEVASFADGERPRWLELKNRLVAGDGPLASRDVLGGAWSEEVAQEGQGPPLQVISAGVPAEGGEVWALVFARADRPYDESHAALLEHLVLLYAFMLRSHPNRTAIELLRQRLWVATSGLKGVDLHEVAELAAQLETSLGSKLDACLRMLSAGDQAGAEPEVLSRARQLLDESLSELQYLTLRLHPTGPWDGDLSESLGRLCRRESQRLGLEVTFSLRGELPALESNQKTLLYRAAQELIANAFRHGGAGRVVITLDSRPEGVRLEVADDGHGLGGRRTTGLYSQGMGLFTLKEQSLSLGGRFGLEEQPAGGTKVSVSLPVNRRPAGREERPVRVLIAEGHPLTRMGLAGLLGIRRELEVAAETSDGEEALRLCRALSPEVAILDTALPGLDVVRATRDLAAEQPDLKVIGFSARSDPNLVHEMLAAGASSFVVKNAKLEELLEAISTVHGGGVYLSPEITSLIIENIQRPQQASPHAELDQLTPRERELLRLMADGNDARGIAERLELSVNTVYVHRRNIMEKLGVRNNTELVRLAMRLGLCETG
jgi:DNA-binding NarL/FixJ family response regulator/signal transduction histidine kinase